MEYNTLIKHTLESPVLSKAIQEIEDDSGYFNLIDPNWETKLKEYPAHQRHLSGQVEYNRGKTCGEEQSAYVRRIIYSKDKYKLIIVSYWTYDASKILKRGYSSFIARDCAPISEISKAMAEKGTRSLHDGARFFMTHCDPNICNTCVQAHTERNIPLDLESNWCVKRLRIFDGKHLKYIFKKPLEDMLKKMGLFLAICQVCIESRTTFQEGKLKVGGNIQQIIVFQETAIKSAPLDFVSLTNYTPAIEYTDDDKEEIQNIKRW